MKTERKSILSHEVAFGLFLVVTWLRLVLATGVLSPAALLYFAFIAVNIALIWFCRCQETDLRWRLRLLFYPLAMNVLYPHMRVAFPRIQPLHFDAFLQSVDSATIGGNVSLRLQPFVHPAFTEFFSFCYLLFFPYLAFSLITYFCGDLARLKKFITGLFTIYGLGFLGYSFLPAAGPHLAMADQFTVPLTGGWFTKWNAAVVARGSNGVDVFPSLHCAVSCFLLFFDRRHRPWRFWFYLVPCVGLWCSTLYLRYHYAIDVVCGFALAAFALWLTERLPFKAETRTPAPLLPEMSPSKLKNL